MLSFSRKTIAVIFSLLCAGAILFAEEASQTVITVRRAETTETKKDPETGNQLVIFRGSVELDVERGNTKITISAQQVQFDRNRQVMFASGNITFTQTKSGESETMTAENILLNVKTLEGFFDENRIVQEKSDALNLDGSTMIVFANMTGRDESGTIAFKNADLTFCDDDDPHWKIKATRIWLLPGNEFAFFNALIFVGPIPVAYLPFFYYPKDEMILNPAFGSDTRKGMFFQTTVYILGRKPLPSDTDEDSLYNFVRPTELKEQRREGLFLRNLDERYSASNSNIIKIMADYYSALGFMTGIKGNASVKDFRTNFDAYLGFSKTLYANDLSDETKYTPYDYDNWSPGEEKKVEWNKSNLFGLKLPFRYMFDITASYSPSSFYSLSLDAKLPSDPFFQYDFTEDRAESMDWINYLMNLGNKSSISDTSEQQSYQTFSWKLSGSLSPKVTFLSPVVSSFQISGIESMISFRTRENEELKDAGNDPMRLFYYPEEMVPANFSVSFGGTLLSLSGTRQVKSKTQATTSFVLDLPSTLDESKVSSVNERGESIGEKEEGADENAEETPDANAEEPKTDEPSFSEELFPAPSISAPSLSSFTPFSYSLSYSANGTFKSRFITESGEWKKVSDIDWSDFESKFISVNGTASLKSAFGWRNDFINITNSLNFTPTYQAHPYLSDTKYTTDSSKNSVKKSDYAARKMDMSNQNTVTWKPFVFFNNFAGTSFAWNISEKVLRTEFVGDGENPEWKYRTPKWDEESITSHTLSANLNAIENNFSQNFSFSAQLDPRPQQYTTSASFAFMNLKTSLSTGFEKESTDKDADFKKMPLNQSASFSQKLWASTFSASESYKYSLEDKRHENFSFSTTWAGLNLEYAMARAYDYEYAETERGDFEWSASKEMKFLPQHFNVSYSTGNLDLKWGKSDNFITTFILQTSAKIDLIRPVMSSFKFNPEIRMKVKDIIEISFTANTYNNMIYRYVQKHFDDDVKIPGEENIAKDLWNSFKFWDNAARKSSGFKLDSMTFSATHYIHDWDISFTASIKRNETTKNGKKEYDFTPSWTLSVKWKPFPSITTKIVDDKGEWKLNPKDSS